MDEKRKARVWTSEKGRGGLLGVEAEGQGSAFPSGAGAMRSGLGVRETTGETYQAKGTSSVKASMLERGRCIA